MDDPSSVLTGDPGTAMFDPVEEFKRLWSGTVRAFGAKEATDSPPAGSTGPAAPVAPDANMDSGGVLLIIIVILVLLSVITYVSTQSGLATLVVITILIGFILMLGQLGILNIYISNGILHIEYHELNAKSKDDTHAGITGSASHATDAAPAPSTPDQNASAPKPVTKSEVFHVGGNEYTYQDAPAVCAAYDSELATYDQLTAALSLGAEWCAYGWSQGGMALFPTQQATWAQLQADPISRTACGRPGINGGYFDPATKFGVNCYGPKPNDNTNSKYPLPLPGADPALFNQLVNKFKSQLNNMSVNAFNRSAWSGWNLSAHT